MSARLTVTCLVMVMPPNSVVLATDWIYSGVVPSLLLHPSWFLALGTGHYSDVTGMSRLQTRSVKLTHIPISETNPRALPYGTAVTGSVSVETCTTACYNAGYSLAGMEYSAECCAHAS